MMHKMVKESSKRSSVVLPCLLGLTVAYQMVFQFIVWQKALPAADELESPVLCWGAQKEQQGKHKAVAGQCAEVALFESWQTSENNEALQREEDTEWLTPDLMVVDPKGHIQLRELENHGFGSGSSGPLHPTTAVTASAEPVKSTDADKPLVESDMLQKAGFHLGSLKAAGFSSVDAPESEIVEPKAAMEQNKLEHDLAKVGFHMDHLKAAGFSSVHAKGANSISSKQWSTDVQALKKRVQGGMKHLQDLHEDILSKHLASKKMFHNEKKPELLDKIESLQKELCADHLRQSHPECASLLSSDVTTQRSTPEAAHEDKKEVFVMGQLGSVTHRRIKWNPPNASKPAHHTASHAMAKSSEWIASLSAVQVKMESRYEKLQKERKMRRGRGTMKERKQERLQAIRNRREANSKDVKKHMDELKDGLAKIEHHRAVWESSLEARTMAIGVQMCSEESRRDNPACKYFLHPQSHDGADQSTTTISPVDANGAKLLSLPTLAPSGRPKGLKFLEKRVNSRGLMLTANDLQQNHWVGKIPKVACIMPIQTIRNTSKETWLQHAVTTAVNAFRAENYEGPKQLVIVLHKGDQMASRIANGLADGMFVKVVAAHMPVPSTMSMRYAAWSADKDADVVARWDMNAYHHPDRLSMQVRALGASGRPVSAAMWGVTFSEDGKRSVYGEQAGLENSMVGIRSWMDSHWHPYVEFHDGPLAKVGDLVTLDMPELLRAPKKAEDAQPLK